ncbi:hypothetical protein HB364_29540 [Pseudoflavitalea sp. X16]|uniref:O-antigen ligase family protein n=1 Tax=Paraflavitalea devenefica TaxID=2716334 RepID=UPI0014237D31|nr:O-antigen ligase family protein [Paraflavitalea devenefica]NII29259.1 hypothetical protein [Paraflavitalea devenefica]
MKKSMSYKSYLFALITAIVPALALITIPLYGPASLSAYFFLQIAIALLLLGWGLLALPNNITPAVNRLPLPVLFFAGWLLVLLLQGLLTRQAVPLRVELCVGLGLFLLVTWLLVENKGLAVRPLIVFIAATAGLQSLTCLLQGARVLPSLHPFFPVTGTWVNPNVTAMYLAICVPLLLYMIWTMPGKGYKLFGWATLLCITAALILLQCRTAFIGAVLAAGYFFWHRKPAARYAYIPVLKKLPRWSLAVVIILLCGGLLAALVATKSRSSYSRLLIWKLSGSMVAERPFAGYGTGLFEKEYNSRQAAYFSRNQGTAIEKEVAGFVNMPYNEYLEQLIEGGLPKLLLWIAFLVSLFLINKSGVPEAPRGDASRARPPDNELLLPAKAGVLCFAVMGLFNFTLMALPAACMLMIYAGIIAAQPTTLSVPLRGIAKLHRYRPAALLIGIAGGCMLYYTRAEMTDYSANRKATSLIKKKQYAQALSLLQAKQVELPQSAAYALNKATAWQALGHTDSAIGVLQNALHYSSDPALLTQLGRAYKDRQRFTEAEAVFKQLHYMEPARLTPLYELMLLYQLCGRPKESAATAAIILQQPARIENSSSKAIKKEAALLLTHLNHP